MSEVTPAVLVASTTALISDLNISNAPDLKAPIFITISISWAPFLIAFLVSNDFVSVVLAPNGNPTTVHTLTELSSNNFADKGTYIGFIQTDANSCSFACSQSFLISSTVAVGFKLVWSIILAISRGLIAILISLLIFYKFLLVNSYILQNYK